ncbi:MAG: AAA family ATPase [Chloroflexi bacterium]|nr:AAA family ATPase [Chloroflexota bacterium]
MRIALHSGAAQERDGDYFGPALNRVARLLAIGHGGQTLLTLPTEELVRDNLSEGASLRDLGERRLKDLIRPERVFQLVTPDLPQTFPPLRSLDARPNNLPAQPTPLIGREREVEAVRRRLLRSDTRLLTLTGPGGTGKTRLSLQVAADAIDDFDHGVYFVPLEPVSDAALVPSAIAQALGVRAGARRARSRRAAAAGDVEGVPAREADAAGVGQLRAHHRRRPGHRRVARRLSTTQDARQQPGAPACLRRARVSGSTAAKRRQGRRGAREWRRWRRPRR